MHTYECSAKDGTGIPELMMDIGKRMHQVGLEQDRIAQANGTAGSGGIQIGAPTDKPIPGGKGCKC